VDMRGEGLGEIQGDLLVEGQGEDRLGRQLGDEELDGGGFGTASEGSDHEVLSTARGENDGLLFGSRGHGFAFLVSVREEQR